MTFAQRLYLCALYDSQNKNYYFPKQHYSVGIRNGGPLLLLWAIKWIII